MKEPTDEEVFAYFFDLEDEYLFHSSNPRSRAIAIMRKTLAYQLWVLGREVGSMANAIFGQIRKLTA